MTTSTSFGKSSRVKSPARLDAIRQAVLGDELARDLDHRRQVEDDAADVGLRLRRRDAVAAGPAAEIEDALAPREVNVASEAATGPETDAVRRLVQPAGILDLEGFVHPENARRLLASQMLRESAPLVAVGACQQDPRAGVGLLALDQELLHVGGVGEVLAVGNDQPQGGARHQQALGVGGGDIECRGQARDGVDALRDQREQAELDGGYEHRRVPVGIGHVLQANAVDGLLMHGPSSTSGEIGQAHGECGRLPQNVFDQIADWADVADHAGDLPRGDGPLLGGLLLRVRGPMRQRTGHRINSFRYSVRGNSRCFS